MNYDMRIFSMIWSVRPLSHLECHCSNATALTPVLLGPYFVLAICRPSFNRAGHLREITFEKCCKTMQNPLQPACRCKYTTAL